MPPESDPRVPPQAGPLAHPCLRQIRSIAYDELALKTITSALEGDHLGGGFNFFLALFLLVSRAFQRGFIFQISAVKCPDFDAGPEVLFHLALTVSLQVLHGAAEDAASALRGRRDKISDIFKIGLLIVIFLKIFWNLHFKIALLS